MESLVTQLASLTFEVDKRTQLGAYYRSLKIYVEYWRIKERNELVLLNDETNNKYMFLKVLECRLTAAV